MAKKGIPKELEGVAFTEDVNAIQEQVDKCYSAQRYKEFQDAVEEIIGKFLKGKVGWAIALWIVSIVGSMLVQKYLTLF